MAVTGFNIFSWPLEAVCNKLAIAVGTGAVWGAILACFGGV